MPLSFLDDRRRALALALIAFGLFSSGDAVVKLLSQRMPILQVTALLMAVALCLIAGFTLATEGPRALWPRHPRLGAARTLLMVVDTVAIFYAFSVLPLADAYAIAFMAPILQAVLAVRLLGERLPLLGWASVLIGFLGVMVVLRPGFAELTPAHLAVLLAAVVYTGSNLMLRVMPSDESDLALVTMLMLGLLTVTVPSLLFATGPVRAADLPLILGGGTLFAVANLLLVRAYRLGQASSLAPTQYSQLLYGLILGLLVFGDAADGYTLLGGGIVVLAGLILLRVRPAAA